MRCVTSLVLAVGTALVWAVSVWPPVPRPLGWVKIVRDNMGWRGYLCIEPVY